jgi:hypothetical protein
MAKKIPIFGELESRTDTGIVVDYSAVGNAPIIKADISTLANPIADTCYIHIGSTDTYVNGKIYFYDGNKFSAINKGGVTVEFDENDDGNLIIK